MPVKFLKPLNDFERKIFSRFAYDVEKFAFDLQAQVKILSIGNENNTPYVITETERIFSENENRVDMMADSLTWQAYQLGLTQGLFDQQDIIEWNLDPGAEHCDTCLEYAAIRYFTIDTLPGIPGEAPTICDGGCKCYLT